MSQHHIVIRDQGLDAFWDAKVKNQVYDPNTLSWVAQVGSTGGGTTVTSASQKTVIVDQSGSTIYVGKADIGSATSAAVWQVKKVVTSGTVLTTTFADGNSNFDNVWNNRASLSYS